jgi:hypothetical protein
MSADLWLDDPKIQQQYIRVLEHTRRLQAELGIKPRTIEERCQDYRKRKEEEQRRQEELQRYSKLVGSARPPLRWKVK